MANFYENTQCVMEEKAILGESPLWSQEENAVYWVDIFGKKLHIFYPLTQKKQTIEMPEIVSSVNLIKKGGLILTFKKKVVAFNQITHEMNTIVELEPHLPENRCNDAKCDPKGRLWVGTMSNHDFRVTSGALYRVDADGHVHQYEKEIGCSNGMGWSLDHKKMYFIESSDAFRRGVIYVYDFDNEAGEISNRCVFDITEKNSKVTFDGMDIDEKGNLWVAMVGIPKIRVYSPQGIIQDEIELPAPFITSCAFGNIDLSTLYVTTATESLSQTALEKYPLAGSLFAIKTKVKGRLPFAFNG